MLDTPAPKRPHALLVGPLLAIAGGDRDPDLELRLSALDGLEEAVRPSLVVVTAPELPQVERRSRWRRRADAVLDGRRGGREMMAGIQGAVRARRLASALARRDG